MDAPEPSPELRAVTTEHLTVVGPPPATDGRSMPEIVRSIATDTSTLFRKEVELAKQELGAAVAAKLKAVAAFGAAGVLAVFMVFFFGFAAAYALDIVLPIWAAFLIVGGVFLLGVGLAALFGLRKMKVPVKPEHTQRTVKEDVEWARAQLKR
jgi:Putative Actinobacterial Holin-X, holin superfamily III